MSGRYRQQPLTYLYEYMNKEVIVMFMDGREIEGVLSNYDERFNLFMTNCTEYIHDMTNRSERTGETRQLGEVFCRGQNVVDVMLKEGFIPVEN